jgi:hypothetical protein
MIALLVVEDNSPLAETIRRGAWPAGAFPIVLETFGKVAHPTPIFRMGTIRLIKQKRLRVVMCSFLASLRSAAGEGRRFGSRRGLKLADQKDKNKLVEHLKSHYLRDHFRSS